MTSWDDLNAIDEPASNSIAHTIIMWSACLAIWMICVPLDLLARPRKGLRTSGYGRAECADLGEELNHYGQTNIPGAERDHG